MFSATGSLTGGQPQLGHGTVTITTRPNRAFDEGAKSFFERDWPDWLTGRIFDVDMDGLW